MDVMCILMRAQRETRRVRGKRGTGWKKEGATRRKARQESGHSKDAIPMSQVRWRSFSLRTPAPSSLLLSCAAAAFRHLRNYLGKGTRNNKNLLLQADGVSELDEIRLALPVKPRVGARHFLGVLSVWSWRCWARSDRESGAIRMQCLERVLVFHKRSRRGQALGCKRGKRRILGWERRDACLL